MNYIQLIANAYFWAYIITMIIVFLTMLTKEYENVRYLLKLNDLNKAKQGKYSYGVWKLFIQTFLFILATMLR